jgi:hypothetical protein
MPDIPPPTMATRILSLEAVMVCEDIFGRFQLFDTVVVYEISSSVALSILVCSSMNGDFSDMFAPRNQVMTNQDVLYQPHDVFGYYGIMNGRLCVYLLCYAVEAMERSSPLAILFFLVVVVGEEEE